MASALVIPEPIPRRATGLRAGDTQCASRDWLPLNRVHAHFEAPLGLAVLARALGAEERVAVVVLVPGYAPAVALCELFGGVEGVGAGMG
jgi:hypothetical protein